MKQAIIVIIVIALLGVGVYLWQNNINPEPTQQAGLVSSELLDVAPEEAAEPINTKVVTGSSELEPADSVETTATPAITTIGQSRAGRPITAYRFGAGSVNILVVGGMHGAFSPNSKELAEQLIEHVTNNTRFVPASVTLHVVPNLNPDGLALRELPAGRFNANGVDLNRNFDCQWQASGVWQNQPVSGGRAPFSEPEAVALRDYVTDIKPAAAIIYYAAGGGVYAAQCQTQASDTTLRLTEIYAQAAGYTSHPVFASYPVTGDAANWLASEQIPTISVLLSDYANSQWSQNRAGLTAFLNHFAE